MESTSPCNSLFGHSLPLGEWGPFTVTKFFYPCHIHSHISGFISCHFYSFSTQILLLLAFCCWACAALFGFHGGRGGIPWWQHHNRRLVYKGQTLMNTEQHFVEHMLSNRTTGVVAVKSRRKKNGFNIWFSVEELNEALCEKSNSRIFCWPGVLLLNVWSEHKSSDRAIFTELVQHRQ